ncbi:MAG: hypothetical protein R3236_04200 [Phycisphaeraceae bacterium]|nr:hypothetical protein [Phycisphaeraceae bacterium]
MNLRGLIACWVMSGGLIGALIGCAAPGPADQTPPEADGSRGQPMKLLQQNQRHFPGPDDHQTSPWRLHVEVLLLPREKDLSAAAAGLDEPDIGHAKRLLWSYNGFAIGQVATDALGLFRPLLGRVVERPQHFILQDATTFQPIPLNRRDVRVNLATSRSLTEKTLETRFFSRGRFQLLLRIDPKRDITELAKDDTFTMVPQHHRPKLSALVRTPQQKLLDGTIFEDLKLTLPIRPGRSLVLFPRLPPAARPPQNKPKAELQDNPELPGLRTVAPTTGRVQRPVSLAEAMLSGRLKKTKQAVQAVLILRAEPKPRTLGPEAQP